MANEIITHYENYKESHGDQAYTMAKAKDSSRVRFIKEYLERYVKEGSKILDIGCGDMFLSQYLPQYQWVGIDIAPNMSDGKAIKHDLMTSPYPFKDQEFDAAVCSEVLEHVWDLRVVHKEAHRLLKPNGIYLISTPNYDNIDYKLSNYRELLFDDKYSHMLEHIRQYNYEVHEKFLKQAKFKVVTFTGCDAHYVKFFKEARDVLYAFLNNNLKVGADSAMVDQVIGQMFKKHDHTILIVSQK